MFNVTSTNFNVFRFNPCLAFHITSSEFCHIPISLLISGLSFVSWHEAQSSFWVIIWAQRSRWEFYMRGWSRQWNKEAYRRKIKIIVKLGLDYVIIKGTASKAVARFKAVNKRMTDRNRIWQDPQQRKVKYMNLVITRIKA